MSEHRILTMEALEASLVPTEWVPVPEWGEGMEVLVCGLTPEEVFKLEPGKTNDAGDANARLLAVAVRQPKWTAAAWRKAEIKLAAPYLRVLQAAQRLSGLYEGAADEAQKNSLTTQG